MIVVAFLGAAAAGTLCRWGLSATLPPPTGTLVANLFGAFALGWLGGSSSTDTVLGVAALGSLTTFSTLALELVQLAPTRPRLALLYGGVTIVGGVGLAWAGLHLS